MFEQLIAQDIVKSYGKRMILRGISMQLNSNEIVGLFGPNGAGKTTCFSIIAGLIYPDAGKLFLCDQDITNLPIYMRGRLGISYLPQESSVFRGLSVIDNIKAVLEIVEKDNSQIDKIAENLLAEFSISHLRNVLSINLSGGERRRLEIARILAANPKFIMLDEPLAGIDPLAILDIKNLIKHLRERNIGVLITDHNVKETLDILDRAYIIYDGQVLVEGTVDEITSNKHAREFYLGWD